MLEGVDDVFSSLGFLGPDAVVFLVELRMEQFSVSYGTLAGY